MNFAVIARPRGAQVCRQRRHVRVPYPRQSQKDPIIVAEITALIVEYGVEYSNIGARLVWIIWRAAPPLLNAAWAAYNVAVMMSTRGWVLRGMLCIADCDTLF